MKLPGQALYRIDGIEVDPASACVRRDGKEYHLRARSLEVLLYLLERRSRLVGKEELLTNLWDGAAVSDDALTQCIGDLRKALGDDSRNPRYLKTVPKQGYQFIGNAIVPAGGEVEIETTTAIEVEVTETLPAPAALPAPASRKPWLYALAATALLTAAATWTLASRNRVNPTLPEMAGKTPVAVMFFENRSGNRDLDWLREGVPDMLITNLSRSPKLALLAREHLMMLLDRAGYDPAVKIGLQPALDLARHGHASVVILGAFTSLGQALRLDAQIYNARDGRLLAGESLTVEHPRDLLARFDTLSARIALRLGAAIPGMGGPGELAEARTNNVEAFRAYSVGIERAQQYHMREALDLFRKAAELDPRFVMAQARIGYTFAVASGKVEEGRPYLAKAFEQSQTLPARDRLYIGAWYALACKDYAAATKAYRQIVADYPAEVPAYVSLGRVLRGEGHQHEALDVLHRGLLLDPDYADAYNALSGVYFELGKREEAMASARRAVELSPREPNMHDSLGLVHQQAGRYAEAIECYQRALGLKPDFELAVIHLGNTYFQLGRYREAIAQFRRYVEIAPAAADRARGVESLGWVYWTKHDLDRAAGELEKWPASSYKAKLARLVAFERGKLPATPELRAFLSTEDGVANRNSRLGDRMPLYLLGRLELKAGRPEEAIRALQQALREPPPYWTLDDRESCLGEAYLELRRLDEAIVEYRRVLKTNPNRALARYQLGLALDRKGDRAGARGEFQRFLEIWKNGDEDVPERMDALRRARE